MKTYARILVALLLNLMALTSFSQGAYWESIVSGAADKTKERTDKSYYMPRMLKMVNGEDGSMVILRLDKELMMMVNAKEKSYWQMTFAEMENMMKGVSSQMQAQMEEMKKQMAELPEEQRKMAEQMMGQSGLMTGKDRKIETVKTGESKTISGYGCTKHVVKADGKETLTVWASKDVKEFAAMRKDMEEFARRMKEMLPPGERRAVDIIREDRDTR